MLNVLDSIQTFDTLSVITTQNAKLRGRLKIKIPNFEPILSRDALSVQHELFSDEYISYIEVLLKRDRVSKTWKEKPTKCDLLWQAPNTSSGLVTCPYQQRYFERYRFRIVG